MKSGFLLLIVSVIAGYGQTTVATTDSAKAYSSIGIAPGDKLRLSVVNVTGTNGTPPDPCNVQMGFVNTAGALVKSASATINAGHTGVLTLTFNEAAAGATATDTPARLNLRPVLSTTPPDPCRTISSTEVIAGVTNRTYAYAVPIIAPPGPPINPPTDSNGVTPAATNTIPPGPPDFGPAGITLGEFVRFNVTNITGSNGTPPDPCNVQLSFVDGDGNSLKSVAGTIAPGRTAFLAINFVEAAPAVSAVALPRAIVRPVLVKTPPDPCRISASAELVDAASGRTAVYIEPADPAPAVSAIPVNTPGQ